ncbi:tyrosyl-trna synthetase [Hordeum vulgare]|nr:tyrosyl-trna synthetase [Hordeum vulgare]
MTKIHDDEHEDCTTKMSKPDELQDGASKSDFNAIPICGINYVESSITLFEDSSVTTVTSEPIKEHALEASDKVASKDDASILGGESDDVPSSAFIHGGSDDMVEHGIFPSTTTTFGDELRGYCHIIESEIDFTTSPICDEFLQFPCPIYDDAPILNEFFLPLDNTMAMVDYDAPPHGSITMKMTTIWSLPAHLQHMSGMKVVK